MNTTILGIRLLSALLTATGMAAADKLPKPPNILFIFCDDLGYGDIGVFHQNQRAGEQDRSVPYFSTPHIDAMAKGGMIFEQHYCGAPVCAPSRATLLSGQHQGHSERRDNQFDLPFPETHTLASVVKQAGYATAACGKWGLQGKADKPEKRGDVFPMGAKFPDWPTMPMDRGFDYFLGYVRHRDGHSHYPVEDGKQVWENKTEVSKGMELCFSTDLFTAATKKWIIEHHAKNPQQPFFAYLAYDTPHAKLQNPPCAYPEGGGLKGGVQWLGEPGRMLNTAQGTYDGWMHPDYAKATWDHDKDPKTDEVPWPTVQKRYANLVRRMDDNVGDLMQLLEDLDIADNTLVIFSSDNGPSQESYIQGDPYHPTFFDGFGGFDGIKRDTLEGGLRVPTIARWPAVIRKKSKAWKASGHWDWLPTFAEAAGVPAPASSDGVSLIPTLSGMGHQPPSTIYSEYAVDGRTPKYKQFHPSHQGKKRGQMQVIHFSSFKGIRTDIQSADDNFEIYDLKKDPQEIHNLAGNAGFEPIQQLMKAAALRNRLPHPAAPRPYDNAPVPGYPTLEHPQTPGATAPIQPGAFFSAVSGESPWIRHIPPQTLAIRYQPQGFTLPDEGLPESPSSGQIAAYIHIPADGRYTFQVDSNSHTMLFVHRIRLLEENKQLGAKARSGSLPLSAGWHPVRLLFRTTKGMPTASLSVTDHNGKAVELGPESMRTLPFNR